MPQESEFANKYERMTEKNSQFQAVFDLPVNESAQTIADKVLKARRLAYQAFLHPIPK